MNIPYVAFLFIKLGAKLFKMFVCRKFLLIMPPKGKIKEIKRLPATTRKPARCCEETCPVLLGKRKVAVFLCLLSVFDGETVVVWWQIIVWYCHSETGL